MTYGMFSQTAKTLIRLDESPGRPEVSLAAHAITFYFISLEMAEKGNLHCTHMQKCTSF